MCRNKKQDEYVAVSVSDSAVEAVRQHTRSREEHHQKKAFVEECRELLAKHGLEVEG